MTNKISILITRSIIAPILLAGLTSQVVAQYPGWPHDGSLYILTTPDGADLPYPCLAWTKRRMPSST